MKVYEGHEVAGVYYSSVDYDKFKKLSENRGVTSNRRDKLVASFSRMDITNPIIVNEKMEIIDGQGRYEARKQLGLPIVYIVVDGIGIKECMVMNQYNKPWTSNDFVESYASAGNENYKRLIDVCKEFDIPVLRAMKLGGYAAAELKEKLSEGKLVFPEEKADKVARIIGHAKDIVNALQFTGRLNDAFYNAVKVATETEGYSEYKMIRNCAQCRSTYVQMASLKDELKEFSRIYNKGARGNKIYFEDYMRNKGYAVRNYDGGYFGDKEDVSTLV